jgi:uncharacterized protein (DUF58 family)
MKRAFRLATLLAPSCLGWYFALKAPYRGELVEAVRLALGPLWMLLAAALLTRAIVLVARRRPVLEELDVLTASGSAIAWTSALTIVGAAWIGWASLSVLGLLGTGVFHAVVLLTLFALRGDPLRRLTIARRFAPDVVSEGDAVIEEIKVAGAAIPIGFRLFLSGKVGPRWATSRHVLEGAETGGETVLESDVGPAVRGEHEPEPLEVWLEDALGICRSNRLRIDAAPLRVLPRVGAIDEAPLLPGRGDGPRAPRATPRLPTEGNLELREYRPGDDARRIHWVRSLVAGELVVRLPDEVPPDRPRVRLVLDSFFPEALTLHCDAPSELLDAMVRVWLAIGRGLAEAGTQVTLVSALPEGPARHHMRLRTPDAARRLGALVKWQSQVPVDALLTDETTLVVARAVLTRPPESGNVRWVIVAPYLSTPAAPLSFAARHAFPMGAPDNRVSVRRRLTSVRARARRDHAVALTLMRAGVVRPPPGSFTAYAQPDGEIRLEAMR